MSQTKELDGTINSSEVEDYQKIVGDGQVVCKYITVESVLTVFSTGKGDTE